MQSTKKIEFNPAFLSAGGSSKTKKNRAPKVAPIFSPNVLRNKLLKRIKEHKKKELTPLGGSVNVSSATNNNIQSLAQKNNDDEFNNSFKLLEELAKKNKQTTNLHNKSLKHYTPHYPEVHLELPDDLKENNHQTVTVPLLNTSSIISNNLPIITKYEEMPYGILKNGQKPTYRQWKNKTQKNIESAEDKNFETLSRAQKLKDLQLKFNSLEKKILQPKPAKESVIIPTSTPSLQTIPPPISIINVIPPTDSLITVVGGGKKINDNKKLLKRTIRRKYTLGKSKLKRSVSVLLKDRNTRKNILIAHRALKTVPINEINVYLKKQNLIKIGSNAPSDIIRQIYESAILAGEITNTNKDILLHNFVKGESDVTF